MRLERWLLVLPGAIAALVIGSLAGSIVGSRFGQAAADTGSAFAAVFAFVFAASMISPAHRRRVGLVSAAVVAALALGMITLPSLVTLEEVNLSTRERFVTPVAHILGAVCALFVLWKVRQMGFSPGEAALIWQDQARGDHEGAVRRIEAIQSKRREEFRKATGIDVEAIVPEIGRLISWCDIARHIFRVCEFDTAGTTVGPDGQIYPVSQLSPYGYLLVESPILNQKARLPIIHRDDFILAASVFDDPTVAGRLSHEDLLVTYAPKHQRHDGRSGSSHHVLHYVLTPRGALDRYYAVDNEFHMRRPSPEKLFEPFVYEGLISVGVNPEPEL